MQVGVKDLAWPQHRAFDGLRLLDLDDHFRLGKDVCGRGDEPGARCEVLLVGATDGGAGVALHQHLVPVRDKFTHAGGRQTDAVFMVLDFFGYADQHGALLWG